jgi:hypothetical protein
MTSFIFLFSTKLLTILSSLTVVSLDLREVITAFPHYLPPLGINFLLAIAL